MLETLFALRANRTTVRTEVLARLTTFLTMAYVICINPSILGDAGLLKPGQTDGLNRAADVKPITWVIAAVFLFKFFYTGSAG